MRDPLVSVLIPCYNAEKYIGQSVESCLSQTWKNLEIIVVDDGSTDQSMAVLREIKDKRLKIIDQVNRGASSARNLAYKHAQGLYIQHLDADDLLCPKKISGQMEKLIPYGNDRVISLAKTVYFFDGDRPENGIVQSDWPIVDHDHPVDWLIEMLGPETGSMVQPGSWLSPRAITDLIGPWNEAIDPSPDVDGEYFARAVLASRLIRRSAEGAAYYRKYRNSQSMSGKRSEEYMKGGLRSLDLISNHVLKKAQTERAKKALARRYKEWAFTCYPVARKVTEACLQKAKNLGHDTYRPVFPTKIGRALCALFGWKATKLLNHIYHKAKKYLDPR